MDNADFIKGIEEWGISQYKEMAEEAPKIRNAFYEFTESKKRKALAVLYRTRCHSALRQNLSTVRDSNHEYFTQSPYKQ